MANNSTISIKDKIKKMSLDERKKYMNDLVQQLWFIHESDKQRIIKSKKLIEFAIACKDKKFEGIGYYHLAAYFNASQNRYPEFKPTIHKAIEILKRTKQYSMLSSAYLLLGVDAINLGQYNLNLDYFLIAKHYADMSKDDYLLSIVYYYFSGVYIMVKDYDTALFYAKEAVRRVDKKNESLTVFGSDVKDMAYSMLGQCYMILGKSDKVQTCYKKSLKRKECYIASPDCPNTALIYCFHIMALHDAGNFAERDKKCEEFIELLKKHKPSPPFIMHILNANSFMLRVGLIDYTRKIILILDEANKKIQNPNFGLIIAYQKVMLAKIDNDEKALMEAMQEHFVYYKKNNDLVLENLRVATELRVEMDDMQNSKNELKILKASNEAKSLFLSNMSHEMRTPLNAILGMDEIILRQTREEETYKYASDIKTAGNTLLAIINEVLDSSKIEAGKMDIIPVEYDLGSVVNDLVNMIKQRIEDKGLAFNIDVDPNIPYLLYGDEIRIKQCVLNILTNAVKYTETGSITLKISCSWPINEKNWKLHKDNYKKIDGTKSEIGDDAGSKDGLRPVLVRFRVIDTGIGIKKEDINKLTKPFVRIEEERNRTIEGTGLGMNIVQNLLNLMGSKLEVESVYGEGSDFSFELLQGARTEEPIGNYTDRYKAYVSKKEQYKTGFTAPNARVLVVDDTSANLTVARGLIKPMLINVDTATSGKETLEKVKTNKYDILFIDHRMPEMDGVETLQALKKQMDNMSRDAVCIVLTANVISGARDKFLAQGFDDYLAKPIDTEKLERMLREYLPKEYIEEAGDTCTVKNEIAVNYKPPFSDKKDVEEYEDEDIKRLSEIPELDVKQALKNCADSKEILIDTIKDFILSVKTLPDKIDNFCKEGDIKNYTILVHGLKSSSRLIGAMDLSDSAAFLEKCGDNGDQLNISSMTPFLLADMKKLCENLKLFCSDRNIDISSPFDDNDKASNGENTDIVDIAGSNSDKADVEENKPEIDQDTLLGFYAGIKEFVSAYDFKCAMDVLEMLSDYRLPPEDKEKARKLYELIRNVDHDGVMELL